MANHNVLRNRRIILCRRDALKVGCKAVIAAAPIWNALTNQLVSQDLSLSELLEKTECELPIYFPIEYSYVGRLIKDRSLIKIQINNCASQRTRDEFMSKSQDEKNKLFEDYEPIHEFITFGYEPYGGSLDSYKGLEKKGEYWLFKIKGSGDELKTLSIEYASRSENDELVRTDIPLIDYFNMIFNETILPSLERCTP